MKYLKNIYDINIDDKPLVLDFVNEIKNIEFKNDKDIVFFAFNIAKELTHFYNAYDYRENLEQNLEVHDVFKLVNIYGYCLCRQACLLMGFICDIFAIKNRSYYIGSKTINMDHFIIEIYYDNSWHCFDPDLGIYFVKNNKVVTKEEIRDGLFDNFQGDLKIDQWININNNLYFLKNKNIFIKKYRRMFIEQIDYFEMYDVERFSYKSKFMRNMSIVKWYGYNKKEFFLNELDTITTIENGIGIVYGEIIFSNDKIKFLNYLLKFKPNLKEKEIEFNDFPLMILDISMNFTQNQSNIVVFINGVKYDVVYNNKEWLFKKLLKINKELFKLPIYSFYIKSNLEIENYTIKVLSTVFKEKIFNLIRKYKNKLQNKR